MVWGNRIQRLPSIWIIRSPFNSGALRFLFPVLARCLPSLCHHHGNAPHDINSIVHSRRSSTGCTPRTCGGTCHVGQGLSGAWKHRRRRQTARVKRTFKSGRQVEWQLEWDGKCFGETLWVTEERHLTQPGGDKEGNRKGVAPRIES